MSFEFNPIKEATDGKIAKRIVWTTKTLEKAIQGIVTGKKLVANPFYDKEIKLLKADLVFQRTEEEIAEWRHCASDILYFAEKYCKLMTPEGIQNIKLRDYQKKYLHHLQENRLSIYLACRQCGKCATFLTTIDCQIDTSCEYCLQVKKNWKNYYFIKEDMYRVPLFELYNLVNKSFKWKIKYHLYKIMYKLWQKDQRVKKIPGNV